MCAAAEMDGGFLFSYSDIVFRREVAQSAARATGDYALVVDRRWDEAYEGRDQHPVTEAELAQVDERGRVTRVGKRKLQPAQARGEFIGLARFSARAAETMRSEYRRLARELGGAPFGDAARFEAAYLTDLLNHLIDAGERMEAVEIDGGWREIDTTQDLDRARAIVDW
jgi:choline kinase